MNEAPACPVGKSHAMGYIQEIQVSSPAKQSCTHSFDGANINCPISRSVLFVSVRGI